MADILYEDNHVLVAVKPPNMLSQADITGDTDILTLLKVYLKEKYGKPGNVYLGLVHRLDRPVGGLMVFARTSKAASRLSAQLRVHEMGREYLCVVLGEIPENDFTLQDYLVKDEVRNRVTVCDADTRGAQLAILHGHVVERRQNTSLCAIRLETGRNHQIRVQMSAMGHPLWGDNRYGRGIPGQQIALWGYRLVFEHPVTHEEMVFHDMPYGSVWDIYRDYLAIPGDLSGGDKHPDPEELREEERETYRELFDQVIQPEPEVFRETEAGGLDPAGPENDLHDENPGKGTTEA